VLTNVGLLVFKEDNFVNPLKLVPLVDLKIVQLDRKVYNRDFIFGLSTGASDE